MTSEYLSFKSAKIMQENINWLLNSDIRIKTGPNKGALYGWKNLSPPSFPFIYSEITGYAVTCFCWMAQEYGYKEALDGANQAVGWITRNLNSNLVFAKPSVKTDEPNALSHMFYSFDNGMIIIGLLSLYRITKNAMILVLAKHMANALIERFFDGEKLIARLDRSFKKIKPDEERGIIKWSTVSGPYHCKLSMALLQLAELTDNQRYAEISDYLCNYAISLQRSDGQFTTNPGSDMVYLHPHLYSCEGLLYSGIMRTNQSYNKAAINGIKWALNVLTDEGGLSRDTGMKVEQSDCTAQLLRLLVLCRADLENSIDKSDLIKIIDRLHRRLLDFYLPTGDGRGAMKYQLGKETVCSWCTMFSAQALSLWAQTEPHRWIDYFV